MLPVTVLLFTSVYRVADRAPYLLPVYVIVGVWCGVGLPAIGGWLQQQRHVVDTIAQFYE